MELVGDLSPSSKARDCKRARSKGVVRREATAREAMENGGSVGVIELKNI